MLNHTLGGSSPFLLASRTWILLSACTNKRGVVPFEFIGMLLGRVALRRYVRKDTSVAHDSSGTCMFIQI